MIYFRITLHININVLPCIAFSLNYVIACEVNLLVDIMVKLKCTFGDTNCNFETQELEFGQSKELLETHLQFAHPTQDGGNNDRKPEKFPRPDLKLDSSAEEWSKFLNF